MHMILFCYGTRPEWIKISPVIQLLHRDAYKILFTGQHTTLVHGEYDYHLDISDGKNRLDSIVQSCLNKEIFDGIKYVLVQGDTTTAFALALASFHRRIPIIHLEAGLRTYDLDNPYPEEANRQLISRISSINLAPTEQNKADLIKEGIMEDTIWVTGNTGLDHLAKVETSITNEIIVTVHRRENQDNITDIFSRLNVLALNHPQYTFTIPIHPTPKISNNAHILTNFNVINPINHDEMIQKLASCALIITDSGGLQEEGNFLKKPVIVLRKTTERKESIGIGTFMCEDIADIESIFQHATSYTDWSQPCPYGNGHASQQVVEILKALD